MRLLLLLAMPCFAQPVWTSITTEPFQYFRYGNGLAVEHAADPHPPMTYRFMTAPAPARTVCAIGNRAGVYWYTPSGVPLAGTYAVTNPTEFNVSAPQNGIRGFAFTGTFSGDTSGGGSALEVVYFTDRVCSDGGVEYGFSRDLATDSILVYWSTFANCANDAASLCRKTDDPSLGKNFSNVQQEDAGSMQHGFRIYGLSLHSPYTYRIFVEGGRFHVEVLAGGKIATSCADSTDGARHPCIFDQPVEPWFPIRQLTNGFIVAGTQTVGAPVVGHEAGLIVSDILVEK